MKNKVITNMIVTTIIFFLSLVSLHSQNTFSSDDVILNSLDKQNSAVKVTMESQIVVKLSPGVQPGDILSAFAGISLESFNERLSFRKPKYGDSKFDGNSLEARRARLINSLGEIYYVNIHEGNSEANRYSNLVRRLNASALVEYAEPIHSHSLHMVSEDTPDPLLDQQEYFEAIGMDPYDSNLPDASEIVVAIVDSGTDTEHEDLKDNIYINAGEIPGNGIDDDENGYIDDVSGWDFVGNINREEVENEMLKPDNDPTPSHSSNRHGTHVAGCASAVVHNGIGVASPGRGAKILPIKVGADNMNEVYGLYMGYEAIAYAAYMGADIINCSWGGPTFSLYEWDIIKAVTESGSIVVSSAGNDSWNNDLGYSYPTAFPEVISVGASDNGNTPAGFSNYGVDVDVFAPGSSVFSTMPQDLYGGMSGTSMAGPVVAGMAAVALAKFPGLTRDELRARLRYTANPSSVQLEVPLFAGIAQMDGLLTDAMPASMVVSKKDDEDYIEDEIGFNVSNLGGELTNVDISIIKTDEFFNISDENLEFPFINSPEQVTLDFELAEDSPWYRGRSSISILGDYDQGQSADSYGFEFAADSNGAVHEFVGYPMDRFSIGWRFGKQFGDDVWLAGLDFRNIEALIYNPHTGEVYTFGQYYMTALHQFADGSLMIATGADARLIYTQDDFENTVETDLSFLTDYIQGLIVYEDTDRIVVIGSALDDQNICIAVSNDGGESFEMHPIAEQGDNSPSTVAEAISYAGDRIAFADNRGRLYFSSDRGVTWQIYNLPEDAEYVYRLTINELGQIAFFASSDRQYNEPPSLYEIKMDELEEQEPQWHITPSSELPDEIFGYVIGRWMPAGLNFEPVASTDDDQIKPLTMTSSDGMILRRDGIPGAEFKAVPSVRRFEYGIAFPVQLHDSDELISMYMASQYVERLTYPTSMASLTHSIEISDFDFEEDAGIYSITVTDSVEIGKELEIRLPMLVPEESDPGYFAALNYPISQTFMIEDIEDKWLSEGMNDTIVGVFSPEDGGTLYDLFRFKFGENIYEINFVLKGSAVSSVRMLPKYHNDVNPYLLDGMIYLPDNTGSSIISIDGRVVLNTTNRVIDLAAQPSGVYILRWNDTSYKFNITR